MHNGGLFKYDLMNCSAWHEKKPIHLLACAKEKRVTAIVSMKNAARTEYTYTRALIGLVGSLKTAYIT